MSGGVRRWLREPLLQFLLVGLLLFAGFDWMNQDSGERARAGRIELTADDLRQIQFTWLAQGRGALSAEQMQSLVEARVREEILYREALALGLDQDDTIVRRRLAQKMEFLFEDVAALGEPTTAEAREWFEKNPERFETARTRHLPPSLLFARPARAARARRCGARAREDVGQARGFAGCDGSRRSLHVPGLLRRSLVRRGGQDLRSELRTARSSRSRPEPGRVRSSRATAGIWCGSTRAHPPRSPPSKRLSRTFEAAGSRTGVPSSASGPSKRCGRATRWFYRRTSATPQ